MVTADDPTTLSLEELRDVRARLQHEDDVVSYARRVAQARLDLVHAESHRRERGDRDGDLSSELRVVLSQHLTGGPARPPRPTDDLSDDPLSLELDADLRRPRLQPSRGTDGRRARRAGRRARRVRAARLGRSSRSLRAARHVQRRARPPLPRGRGVGRRVARRVLNGGRPATSPLKTARSKATATNGTTDSSTSGRSSARSASSPACRCASSPTSPACRTPTSPRSSAASGGRRPTSCNSSPKALRISVESLYVRAGILQPDRPHELTVAEAIEHDPVLNPEQKQALLNVYESFVKAAG